MMIPNDKAVDPISIMGATKRIAKLIIQKINKLSDTTIIVVRFGNVRGSVFFYSKNKC